MRFRLAIPLLFFAPIALLAYAPAVPVDTDRPLAPADSEWTWPENPENLQVLPQDIGAEGLRSVMRGFTRALGVRCQFCHIGEEGQDLLEFDFVSDDNGHKEIAREMMRMNGAINMELLAGIEGLHGETSPNPAEWRVTCWTCHRGERIPSTRRDEGERMNREEHEHEEGEEHDDNDDDG